MTSIPLYKTRCPKCAENGKDRRGDNLAYYSDGHSYCYSCGYFTRNNLEKLKQPQIKRNTQDLPDDLTTTIVGEPLQWLKKYYSVQDIPWNIMWSPSELKLYFLVIIDNMMVGHQYRYFGTNKDHPKWVSTNINDKLYYIQGTKSTTIVLVEDIISAHKVSYVQQSLCLFGSIISLKRLATLKFLGYTKIIIWLDPDKNKETIKFSSLCNDLGLSYQIIFTEKDPKDYTINEIKDILQ